MDTDSMKITPFESVDLLSLNQYTTRKWSVREAAEGCIRAGLQFIGLWRDKVAETGLAESAHICKESGLIVSGLCRGGMFPATSESGRRMNIDDNRRAIDECVKLGTDTLVLVCGGMSGCTIENARKMVRDGIAAVLPYASECGLRLGIEPLHPMFAADRSVISTLGQALDTAEAIGSPGVGVVIDVYHVWWDPGLYHQIERARGRIYGFHVNDWIAPPPDALLGRGMMGDGVIEIRRIRAAVQAAGYSGPIECEIFNRDIWEMPGDQVLTLMKQRYLEHC
jgi:sugar phosphate isomerase/epimerase